MGFNFGSFAGGLAQGYQKQNDEMRKQKEQDRIDKDNADNDALKAELKASSEAYTANEKANEAKYRDGLKVRDDAIKYNSPESIAIRDASAGIRDASGKAVYGGQPQFKLPSAQSEPTSFSDSMRQNSVNGLGGASKTPAASPVTRTNASMFEAASPDRGGGLADIMKDPQSIPVPDQPVKQETTVFDYLNHLNERIAIKAKYGKVDEGAQLQLQQAMTKIKSEGAIEALNLLNAGRSEEAMKHYDAVGDHRGEKVISSTESVYQIGGIDTPTRIVTMRSSDGHEYKINTAEALHSTMTAEQRLTLGIKANESVTRGRNEERLAKASENTANYQNANLGLAQAKDAREVAKDLKLSVLQDSVLNAKTPEDEALARKKLDTYNYTINRGDPLSSHVNAANAILKDMESTDNQKSAARDYLAGVIASKSINKDTQHGGAIYTMNAKGEIIPQNPPPGVVKPVPETKVNPATKPGDTGLANASPVIQQAANTKKRELDEQNNAKKEIRNNDRLSKVEDGKRNKIKAKEDFISEKDKEMAGASEKYRKFWEEHRVKLALEVKKLKEGK